MQGSGGSMCAYTHKPLAVTYSGGTYPDVRLMSSSGSSLPQRGLLLAENISVQDVGKVCRVCRERKCRCTRGAWRLGGCAAGVLRAGGLPACEQAG